MVIIPYLGVGYLYVDFILWFLRSQVSYLGLYWDVRKHKIATCSQPLITFNLCGINTELLALHVKFYICVTFMSASETFLL